MSEMAGLFTLENKGEARNCSLTTLLFPANFELRKVRNQDNLIMDCEALVA